MSVSKIFKTLIIIVACVVVGAMVLNVLLPNVTTSIINTVEGQIYNATGLSMDFNGDGKRGEANKGKDVNNSNVKVNENGKDAQNSNQVGGFQN